MFEKGIQDGITQVAKRLVKVSNKYMKDQENSYVTSIYHQYLETNNFYGWVMVQKLPTYGRA